MLNSLNTGLAGLKNHQSMMDMIGNNIANVNTLAFKSGRMTFKEGFADMLQGATSPTAGQGGSNPMQLGLGSTIGAIDTSFTQGNFQSTGRNTDLAITGSAMFVTRTGNQQMYTRSGNFQVDGNGTLIAPPTGAVVQGRLAANGILGTSIGDIVLPFGQKTAAHATTAMKLSGNLDASAPIFDTSSYQGSATGFNATTGANPANSKSWSESSLTVYDSLGNKYDVRVNMWKSGTSEWTWAVDPQSLVDAKVPADSISGGGVLSFGPDGMLTAPSPGTINFAPPGAKPVIINVDPGSGVNGLTDIASPNTAVLRDQDGYTSGLLQDFTIDRTGVISGSFSNGQTLTLAQISLADFNNPDGLIRAGDNMYKASANSGSPVVGFASEGSPSSITSGALELSNVDLASEFTQMIVAQRGFQANSKVITTSDEMLQEIMLLKR